MRIAYLEPYPIINENLLFAGLVSTGLSCNELEGQLKILNLFSDFQILNYQEAPHKRTKIQVAAANTSISLKAILDAVQQSSLTPKTKENVQEVMDTLAKAALPLTDQSADEILEQFALPAPSAIAALDFIIGLETLHIEKLYSAPLPIPNGYSGAHESPLEQSPELTLEILRTGHCPIKPLQSNLTATITPTAAAILSCLATFETPTFQLDAIGRAVSSTNPTGSLQVLLGRTVNDEKKQIVLLETNIDDMSPEILGHVTQKLLQEGALDVYQTPIYMKKNRAGIRISVTVKQEDETRIAQLILQETSTLGIRVQPVQHAYSAQSKIEIISTQYGEFPVKLKQMNGRVIQATPEYEACLAAAELHHIPLLRVFQAAQAACEKWIET